MNLFADVARWLSDGASWSGSDGIGVRLGEHAGLSALSVLVAAVVALPVGLYIGHARRAEFVTITIANLGRAVPSFAVIALALPISIQLGLGLGFWPTFVALTLLAIPPIVTNTYVGIKGVDEDAVEAARGMGMTGREVLRQVEIPLAAPVVVAGLRTSAVQVVATATLGALVGWGGLGRFIRDGFSQGDDVLILGGAVLVAALAIATELAFGVLQRAVRRDRGREPIVPGAADVGQVGARGELV